MSNFFSLFQRNRGLAGHFLPGTLFQDAIDGLAGHAEGAGDAGDRLLHALAAADVAHLFRGQTWFAPLVFALGAGDGDALPLPFPYECALELGHGADDLQVQPLKGRSVIRKDETLLVKTHGHAAIRHLFQQMQQIPQIARQPVDAVYMQGIPLPQCCQTFPKFGPVGIPSAYSVQKNLVEPHALKLTFRVLTAAADANITYIHL